MITINWATKVISVPKSYLTLIQSTPTEIRELNINDFRLDLRAEEASEIGIPMDYTHDHVAPVTVGGVELARVVEIKNNYTVTFEDGQYAVNIVGGNSNIGDRVNVNQVSVRTANSAGLVHNSAIEFSSFSGGVTIDVTSNYNGTTFPVGTLQAPVNNVPDARLIAEVRGLDKFYIIGDITLTTGDNVSDFIIYGESPIKSAIVIESGASTQNAEFLNATISGTLDGNAHLECCNIGNLVYVYGCLNTCLLTGTIELAGTQPTRVLNCRDGLPDGGIPTFDMGGSGRDLVVAQYSGDIKITNLTGSEEVSIDLVSGTIWLDSTVTAGAFNLRGVGTVNDQSTGTTINYDGLVSGTLDIDAIADAVWDEIISPDHLADDSAGKYLYDFNEALVEGDVYVSSSTESEILLVRQKLGDAGTLVAETIVDEEAISTDSTTVFPMYQMIFKVNGVWLRTDTDHTGTNYYEGDDGDFDKYTGEITLHSSLPDENTEVLVSYTFYRGLHDQSIDQFLDEAKLYVKSYTRKDYTWSDGLGVGADEETKTALLAAASLAAKRCLQALSAGDIVQLGYNFRLGDFELENMVGGWGRNIGVQIEMLENDIQQKLAILGRSMYFSARSTRAYGRDYHSYHRRGTGTRRSKVR